MAITDVTPLAHEVHGLVRKGDLDAASELSPRERPYPVAEGTIAHLRPAAGSARTD
ncbi:DUF4291 family protein [Nocardiopsis terrae]